MIFLCRSTLLRLLEEKGIEIDAPVAPYVPDLTVPSASGDPVTFRHLLTHTAGFDQLGYDRAADGPENDLPLGTFLASNLVAQRPPGRWCVYDTYGMTLAGYLVEKLSGMPYTSYVVDRVFRPLGMADSGFAGPGLDDLEYAVGYAGHGDERTRQAWEFHHTTPASSANASGADMARLMIALLDDAPHEGLPSPALRREATPRRRAGPRHDGTVLSRPRSDPRAALAAGGPRRSLHRALDQRLRCHHCEGRTDHYWKSEPFERTRRDDVGAGREAVEAKIPLANAPMNLLQNVT